MAFPRGRAAPNRGKPHSEETRKKISESCKKAKVGQWNKGHVMSEEHRRNIAQGAIEWHRKRGTLRKIDREREL